MNVRLESMCHGDGKIYLQMVVDRMQPDTLVMLSAHLKNGVEIPSHLFPFQPLEKSSQANYVVVLPHFEVREVDLLFTGYSGPDAPLDRSRLTVEMNMVKWKTKFNSLVRNELTEQMLDIEREYYADRMNVFFTGAIDDGSDIVVKMLIDMPHIGISDVMVKFLDRTGSELDIPVYPLLDEVRPASRYGDEERLTIGFSVRVSRHDKDFCVNVYDANDVVPGGFALFCDETYLPLREMFLLETLDASLDPRYEGWYRRHRATLADLAVQRRTGFSWEPLIGIVVVVSADSVGLSDMLDPLRQQTYDRFELIVVGPTPSDEASRAALRAWDDDDRLVSIALDGTSDEATAAVTGLLQSTALFCAVLTPDVVLAPEALFEFVRHINEVHEDHLGIQGGVESGAVDISGMPDALEMFYCDEDVLDGEGGLGRCFLKPGFSPDLLYSYDYFGPFVLYSKSLIHRIAQGPGFATEAFAYDLALKAVEVADRVEHVGAVLYHVRAPQTHTEADHEVRREHEEREFLSGRKALANHFHRSGIEAVVLADAELKRYEARYRLPESTPGLSIVIPTKDRPALLDACITSIHASDSYDVCEIVIVDNASTEPETHAFYEMLTEAHADIRILSYEGEYSHPAMVNHAAKTCRGDYLLILDDDTEMITEGALGKLVAHASREDVAVVGAKLLFSDDTVEHAGMAIGPNGAVGIVGVDLPRSRAGYAKRLRCSHNVSAVSGACQLIRKSVFDELGGYSEKFQMAYDDADFCLKAIRAGYFVAFDADVEFYHHETEIIPSVPTGDRRIRLERERAYFRYRWPRYFLEGDPFFGRNLDPASPYYRLLLS